MNKMMIVVVVAHLTAGVVQAAESTGYRKIVGVGCHIRNDVCFVTLEGSAYGSTLGCSSTQARWSVESTPGGMKNFSLITSAWLAGKEVDLYINGCLGNWPTFAWANYR